MIKNIDIFNFLNEKYPVDTAMSFDNVGLLVGEGEAPVQKVLVALDCERTAIDKAIELGCTLIVSHHPVIFSGLKSVTDEDCVYKLIKNGISVISMHTNLDVGIGGVNDCLCDAVGLKNVQTYIASDGFALRIGEVDSLSAADFAKQLKLSLGGSIKYTDNGRPISRVLVCSGSGGDFLSEVKLSACDALLSADIKHNVFIDSVNNGVSVFDAGHFNTEDVVIEPLASTIRGQFSGVDVITYHPDIIYFE